MDAEPKEMTEAEILEFAKAHLGQAVLVAHLKWPAAPPMLFELTGINETKKCIYGFGLSESAPWVSSPKLRMGLEHIAAIYPSTVTADELEQRGYT